ncbi:hypothetical protein [Nonomuraea sp. NPDC050643]|uniref:hypothetical protein n=1 Tax=Nonomuraea sp. NPDC050643 TaxID=3155660 RepID=UPI00340D326E
MRGDVRSDGGRGTVERPLTFAVAALSTPGIGDERLRAVVPTARDEEQEAGT